MSPKSASPQKARTENYFGAGIFLLKICGISLTGNESVGYKVYSFIVLFCTIFSYSLLDLHEMTQQDLQIDSDILTYIAAPIVILLNVVVVLRNRVKFGELLTKIQQPPFSPNPKRGGHVEDKLMKECIWINKIQSYVFCISVSVSFLLTVAYTIIKRTTSNDYHDWKFAYGPLTVLNVTYSPNFEITLIYQTISVGFMVTADSAILLLLGGVLANVCYQFKILQHNIKLMVKKSYDDMIKNNSVNTLPGPLNAGLSTDVSSISWKYFKTQLSNTVRYHLAIIELANDVEQIFRDLVLSTFFVTLCVLCFIVLSASMVTSNIQQVTRMFEALSCSASLLIICYWGERLQYESEQVGRAAYETHFVGTDLRFQKALVFIIRRSQNPCQLTARKISVACLATFTWILRTSYSAYTTLNGINTD